VRPEPPGRRLIANKDVVTSQLNSPRMLAADDDAAFRRGGLRNYQLGPYDPRMVGAYGSTGRTSGVRIT
jgi:hypothetical protein